MHEETTVMTKIPFTTRTEIVGSFGVVSAAHWISAQAGMRQRLRRSGRDGARGHRRASRIKEGSYAQPTAYHYFGAEDGGLGTAVTRRSFQVPLSRT
jgi:hypothetical protein